MNFHTPKNIFENDLRESIDVCKYVHTYVCMDYPMHCITYFKKIKIKVELI